MTADAGDVLLGVDVGTTDTKAVATDPDGTVLAIGRHATRWRHREDGGADIDPATLLDGVLAACRAAVDEVAAHVGRPPRVAGLAVTGMAESGVLVDGRGAPAGPPVVAWFDPRGREEIEELDPELREAFPARTGLPASPLATFAKLLWMRAHLGVELPGHRWLNVSEYVVHALGGEATTEPSLASRTGLFDQDRLTPYEEALAALGAGVDLLPPLVPAGTRLGRVGDSGPEWLRGAVLTVAGHDHPVASLAAGAFGPDDLFDSCGTAEALVRVTERHVTPEERDRLSRHNVTQGAHVLVGRRVLLGGTRGGLLLRRVLAMLGAEEPEARDALDAACPTGDVTLAVHIDGGSLEEQTVRLRIDGEEVSPPLVWRAALEAVADQAQTLMDLFEDVAGPSRRMVAAGGWTKAASYRAVKARRFPGVVFADVDQAGGVGAAAVAAFAAEGTRPVEELAAAVERFVSG